MPTLQWAALYFFQLEMVSKSLYYWQESFWGKKTKKLLCSLCFFSYSGSSCLTRWGVAIELLLAPTDRNLRGQSIQPLCSPKVHVGPVTTLHFVIILSKRVLKAMPGRLQFIWVKIILQRDCSAKSSIIKKTYLPEYIKVSRAGQRHEQHLISTDILQSPLTSISSSSVLSSTSTRCSVTF